MGKQHIIELNGKRYDALTGKMIAMSPVSQSTTKTPASAKKPASLDGFARASTSHVEAPNHLAAHKTERSKTLMRSAVQKPAETSQSHASAPKHPDRIKPSASVVAAHSGTKPTKNIHKSSLIRKFNDMAAGPSTADVAVPAKKAVPTQRLQAVATATAVTASPIEAGLAKADSHNQPRPKRPKMHLRVAKRLRISPRALSAASLVMASFLVVGFFAYQNAPNLSMRLASARAGLEGSLPSYSPAGFGLQGGVSYKPGQIELSYSSHSDDRSYKIIQSTSSWNSETLVQNYEPLTQNSNYQTIPNKGKTVYVYNGSNATWVDAGVWYRIEGDSKLSSDQLLNVADSL